MIAVQRSLTYFQPSGVLQHSQKMSATACRPVSRTRSSADPQPTFTLYRQTHRQSDRSAGRAPRPTHSRHSPCTDRHTDSQTGQQDALLGRPTAHVHPVQTDTPTVRPVSRTRSSADPQPTFTLD